ncbi:MAG: ComEC/Rec2 family competence protein [Actinomycetaceae bacterium]|nr:ComEC/Rec2 family competence protein [Arcanobacterium sp.]MDD7687291.1 ComEC/Rec2 family competence protein [Actinomycetaceae bacterium]MDY5273569.1 ComEC/Rec2 family competence protein [Arcanobacterium sp.]
MGVDARLVGPALAIWAVTATPAVPWYLWIIAAGALMIGALIALRHRGAVDDAAGSAARGLEKSTATEAIEKSAAVNFTSGLAPTLLALALGIAAAAIARELHHEYAANSLHFQQACEYWLSNVYTPVGSWAAARRSDFLQAVSAFPPYVRGLVPGVVIGDDSALPYENVATMRMMGLSHLTAVSGAHVSLVFGVVIGACGKRHPAVTAALAVASLYVLVNLVGPQASVLRAGMMGIFMAVAIGVERRASALPLVCMAVIVACVCFPALATSLGFELSAGTTAAIVIAGYPLSTQLERLMPQVFAQALALPLVAGLASVPLIAGIQPESSIWTVMANVAVAPVVAPLTLCGLAAVVLLPFAAPLAHILVLLCAGCAWWMAAVAQFCAWLPGSHVTVWWAAAVNAALALALWICARSKRRGAERREYRSRQRGRVKERVRGSAATASSIAVVVVVSTVALVAIGGWIHLPLGGLRIDPHWEIVQCDVGQGSALLVRRGNDTVLIDVGPEDGRVDACLRSARVRHIDLLVLSHFDADHVRGLANVLREADVGTAWVSGNPYPRSTSSWVLSLLTQAGATVHAVTAGESYGGWIQVKSPNSFRATPDSTNEDSLVVRVQTPHYSVLALADVSAEIQDNLIDGADLADIVIVAHHGAASQSERLAAVLKPRVALFSVGINSYGHPTERASRVWRAPIMASTRACGWISVAPAGVATQRRCELTAPTPEASTEQAIRGKP